MRLAKQLNECRGLVQGVRAHENPDPHRHQRGRDTDTDVDGEAGWFVVGQVEVAGVEPSPHLLPVVDVQDVTALELG